MSYQGQLIAQRYALQEEIGSGAMGVVWLAHDERLNRKVALKQLRLPPGLSEQDAAEASARAMREGRIAARLQHPHAVSVYDVVGTGPDGNPWLVMEYVPSRSLATVLAEQGPLPPREVARIGRQVADALNAAHRAGIVHRDVKPGNVLLGDNGTVKITDFGISRANWDVTVTRTGILAGTPAYFSPELARGDDPGPAADVYSLGSTLYAAVEGAPPFGVDQNTLALLRAVARGEVPPPRQAGPLAPVLTALLRPEPADRPSMGQAQRWLGEVAAGGDVAETVVIASPAPRTRVGPVLPPGPPEDGPGRHEAERDSHWRRPAIVMALAAVVLALLGIAAWASTGGDDGGRSGDVVASAPPAPPPPPSSTSSTPPSTTSTPPSSSSSSPPPPASADYAETVRTYYGLLPGDTETAWTYLGEPEQAKSGGYSGFTSFWSGIADVQIVSGPQVSGDTVSLTLRFERTSGAVSIERYRLRMSTSDDGRAIIESSSSSGSVNQVVEQDEDNSGPGSGNSGNGNGNGGSGDG